MAIVKQNASLSFVFWYMTILLLCCTTIKPCWSHILRNKNVTGECLPIQNNDNDSSNDNGNGNDAEFHEFHCLSSKSSSSKSSSSSNSNSMVIPCHDEVPECPQWAQRKECQQNPRFMLYHCRKSCETCVSVHHGTIQSFPKKRHHVRTIDPEAADAAQQQQQSSQQQQDVLQEMMILLIQMQQYVYDKIMMNPIMYQSCTNHHSSCTYRAWKGECQSHPHEMKTTCPAICQVC